MDDTQDDMPITLSEDQARGGVTGHNVRYVLGCGLAGIVTAFAAVAVFNGYDRIAAKISSLLALDPMTVLRAALPLVLVTAAGAVAAILLLGLWTRISGASENATQSGMRARVVLQLTLVSAIMAGLYLSAG